MTRMVYHMCPQQAWAEAVAAGRYDGTAADRRDGFIHFSTAEQLPESARRHRAGQAGLVLVAVEADRLGERLRWEPSRGGALFPHLYGPLPLDAVVWNHDLPLGADGRHAFPPLG
jgi:uncharacterized protein (DUF952 family)